MSEWDFDEPQSPQNRPGESVKGGKLNVPMTVCCLLAVTAVSFLTAWLMKDTVRYFLLMGLTFALPFAALMGTSMLVEHATGKMTPQCSRKAQVLCVLATVLAAFVFGCLAELLHQPVVIEHIEPEYDYVLVLDKSGSMVFTELDEPCRKAVHELLDNMENENRVGIVAFGAEVVGSENVRPLDPAQRQAVRKVVDIPIKTWQRTDPITGETYEEGDGTGFSTAMDETIRLIEEMPEQYKPVRIILVTDGDEASIGNFQRFNSWAKSRNQGNPDQKRIELCAIQLGEHPMLDMVKEAVRGTGGQIYDHTSNAMLASQLQSMKSTLVIPEPVDTLKATYEGKTANGEPNTPYMIVTCVLLILLGALSGISLKIMYSVEGQRRIQVYLSPAMGLMAFLLLNFGRMLAISPAWICEGLAFSLFGLVFMRENQSGQGSGQKQQANEDKNLKTQKSEKQRPEFSDHSTSGKTGSGKKKQTPPASEEPVDEWM